LCLFGLETKTTVVSVREPCAVARPRDFVALYLVPALIACVIPLEDYMGVSMSCYYNGNDIEVKVSNLAYSELETRLLGIVRKCEQEFLRASTVPAST
jgi:hypothetical protein